MEPTPVVTPQAPPSVVIPVVPTPTPASKIPSDWKLWFQALSVACYIYILTAIYVGGLAGLGNPKLVNIALGHAGLIMIILSMGMSSFSYYWHLAPHSMVFRKYFGIIGAVFALFHFIFSMVLIQQKSALWPFIQDPHNSVAFFAGLVGLIILVFMTIISHRLAIISLGGQLWRQLMRLGYAAILITLLHILWRNWEMWLGWVMGSGETIVPPIGLLVTIFAVVVCLLRLGMVFAPKKSSSAINSSAG